MRESESECESKSESERVRVSVRVRVGVRVSVRVRVRVGVRVRVKVNKTTLLENNNFNEFQQQTIWLPNYIRHLRQFFYVLVTSHAG